MNPMSSVVAFCYRPYIAMERINITNKMGSDGLASSGDLLSLTVAVEIHMQTCFLLGIYKAGVATAKHTTVSGVWKYI